MPLCQPWQKYRVVGLALNVYDWNMIDYTLSWQCIFNSLTYPYAWTDDNFYSSFSPLSKREKFYFPCVHPYPVNDHCEIRSQWQSRNCSLRLQRSVLSVGPPILCVWVCANLQFNIEVKLIIFIPGQCKLIKCAEKQDPSQLNQQYHKGAYTAQ